MAQDILPFRGAFLLLCPRVPPGILVVAVSAVVLLFPREVRAQFGARADSIARADSLKVDSLQRGLLLPFKDTTTTNAIDRARLFDSLRAKMIDSLSRHRDSVRIYGDSLHARRDTLKIDTTWVVYKDSTSRIRQWVYHRHDEPAVEFFPHDNRSLYVRPRGGYDREVAIDSSGKFVYARETINGKDVKIPASMPLDDYIKLRSRQEVRNIWRETVYKYQYKENRDQLGGLLSNLTSIEIPVPANPLLSIFGGRGIKLNVSGAVDIRGAFRNQKSDQVAISSLDQSRSEPDFNQDVQVNVNGTIGEKLNILADWNTQRTFEYENQLKIKYTGYDDEIVQSVEAGNVSLQTPSLIGGGQALFGIKAKMQAGPLTVTTLLSQKKGQQKELTLTGGAQSNSFILLPTAYSHNYYFVDTLYRKFWEVLHNSAIPDISGIPDIVQKQISQMDVWTNVPVVNTTVAGTYISAAAYTNLPANAFKGHLQVGALAGIDTTSPGNFKIGYWTKLDPTKDYKFDRYGGYVTILTNVNESQAYAVTYTTADQTTYGDTVNGLQYLKLIKPENLQDHPDYKPAWDLMLKNIYPLGGRDLKQEGFDFKLYRRTDAADAYQLYSKNLLEVMGLDRFNSSGAPNPDGVFDFLKGVTVDVDRAEVIFPTLRPFDSTIVRFFRAPPYNKQIADSLLFSDIYDTTVTAAQNNTVKNRYYFQVTSSTSQSSRYQLGFNLVEGSVQVLLNNVPLLVNTDYTVDYIVGEVVIRNPAALVPGANVQVKYETNDLFQLASKTLIGARGELAGALPATTLGFTVMNLNQATLSDKVRLGEEPTSNLIAGVDAATTFNLPFLTSMINALPLIRTREMSSIRIGGEGAYVVPNPNTKTSTITDDNGASIAYIDDFEGARRTIPLPVQYSLWHLASPPVYSRLQPGLTPVEKTYYKGKLAWYNRLPSDVVSQDVWPLRQVRPGEGQITVLNLDFDPNRRGMYNYSPKLDSTLHRAGGVYDSIDVDGRKVRQRNWGGIMRYLPNTAGLLDQNISYLEIWMKSTASDPLDLKHGRLYVDLGRVNEDVIPNNLLNSEDRIKTPDNPSGNPNGVLNPGEDVGLDMMADSSERREFAEFVDENRGDPDVDPNDPSGDDWSYVTGSGDFSHVNGTENNGVSIDGRLPDTEDLNNNGFADQVDLYAEYEVPLDTLYIDSLGREQRNELIVGGSTWHQIRIPLFNATRIIGGDQSITSVLQEVQYMRMWVSGVEQPVSIRIAEMDFVGDQWIERTQNDSTLKVSTVSIEDNPDYTSPPGVIRERDKTQPDQVILGNEQALTLVLNGLKRGDSREVYRSFAVRPLDVFNYKTMKMFVHGDPAFGYYGPDRYDAEAFIRIGSDSLNYYEYRAPVHPGWDPLNDMNIVFSELTAIKANRDSVNQVFRDSVRNGPPGATYGIRGNPSLRQIREISIGVSNPAAQGGTARLVGQVWVNELRLTDVNNAKGYAYHFDTQVKLADLGGVSFNYARTDPNFHALDQTFGSQNTQINWGVSSTVALEKFFPSDWQGTTVPVSYSHSENLIKPNYLPNSDVVVAAAADRAATRAGQADAARVADSVVTSSQTLHVSDSYALPNLRIALPTQLWYIRDTFSKLTWAFNYTTSHDRDPSIAYRRAWLWNFRVSYGVSLPADLYVQPFKNIFNGIFMLDGFKDWKFYYVPIVNVTGSVSAQRSRTYSLGTDIGSIAQDARNFSASKAFGFGWKLTEGGLTGLSGDYGVSLDKNLLTLDNDTAGRTFNSMLRDIFIDGEDSRFGQRVTFNTKPKVPDIFDLPKFMTLNAGYGVNYGWQNSFQHGDIGKSAGFDNNITASVDFRLKSFTDPWFKSDATPSGPIPDRTPRNPADSTAPKGKQDSGGKGNLGGLLSGLKTAAKIFFQIPFLDYESINLSFTQTNRAGNSGIIGSTGFKNFWRLPFQGSLLRNGPSRLYQLGLISDPSGDLLWSPTSSFPWIGWTTQPGPRAALGNLSDQYGQTNNLALRTNRPLWPGATLELNWKVGWAFQKNTTFQTDEFGNRDTAAGSQSVATQGSVERSYLTIPPVLFFKPISGSLEKVGIRFRELTDAGVPQADALSEAFEKGFESLPFLSRLFGSYVPRPNWSIRWDGIEKIVGIGNVIDRMSLEHAYTASFRRDYRGDIVYGGERTDVERVIYGFSPLLGVNATFKEFLKGNMTGNLRYNTATTYDLNLSGLNIVEASTNELTLTVTYSRRGFKFPLFGLSLSNDIDLSLSFSRAKNNRKSYDAQLLDLSQDGTPIEGSTRTNMEPRIKYVLSTRVSASLFYRFTQIAPDDLGSTIPGTTTNEAGVEIHITI